MRNIIDAVTCSLIQITIWLLGVFVFCHMLTLQGHWLMFWGYLTGSLAFYIPLSLQAYMRRHRTQEKK